MWRVVNITLRPPCHRWKISSAAIQHDTAPPRPRREPVCALSLAPARNDTQDRPVRNPHTVLAELHCIILNIDIDAPWTLLLHDTCLKADLACCSNNCCCRWWLPSSSCDAVQSGIIFRHSEEPVASIRRLKIGGRCSAEQAVWRHRQCPEYRCENLLCRLTLPAVSPNCQIVRSGQVTYIWAARRSFPGIKGENTIWEPCRDHVTSLCGPTQLGNLVETTWHHFAVQHN